MGTKIKDLTTDELRTLISNTIKESMEDLVEDLLALSNKKYLNSIEEAREDYKNGKIKRFEDVFDI
jgi:hypothetical protein